ncbi:MAG: DUF3300 domain-containing protein [Woeseiaceae bacterium]
MTIQLSTRTGLAGALALLLAILSPALLAQVPVDDDGNIIGAYESQPSAAASGNENIPLLTTVDLEELIGPIALYPDDLLAIVLPASVYPLQIVDAARFLEDLKVDPALEPNPEWDDAVVALLNYPEVIDLLNDEIDWTWRLGEAVVAQQADVVAAIETFRDRAYAAGNLKSDSYQNVTHEAGTIQITPVSEDTIYVPYYEPERVVVYQPRPVYYYYPTPYPVYYYPYSSSYFFDRSPFWGVTTAFRIGWYSDSLNVFHHSYYGHPYYGRNYQSRWWYRRPSINIYNTTYVQNNARVTVNRHYDGDHWRHRQDRRHSIEDVRIASSRSFQRQPTQRQTSGNRSDSHRQRVVQTRKSVVGEPARQRVEPDRIKFRAPAPVENRRESSQRRSATVKFRERSDTGSTTAARNNVRVTQQQERRTEQRTSSARPRIDQRRPGYKSATDVRRVEPAPVTRRSVETKLARRHDATPPTTQRNQAPRRESREQVLRPDQRHQAPRAEPRAETRAEPRQRQAQTTDRNASKRPAEPRRARSSKSTNKFAARSQQRD